MLFAVLYYNECNISQPDRKLYGSHFNFITKEGLNTIQGPSKLKEDILNYLEQTQHETAEYKEV